MSAEDREESRYIRELKKQIQRLKRENQQLKKSKRRIEALVDIDEPEEVVEEEIPKQKNKNADKDVCPKCNSEDIAVFDLIGRSYYRCRDCQSKGRFLKK